MSAHRVRVTMIPEGQQLFADGVEVKVGDTFGEHAHLEGRYVWNGPGVVAPAPKAYGFAILDEAAEAQRESILRGPYPDADPAPVQASETAELPPLTEAEVAEIEVRANAATPGPWTWDFDQIRGTELRHGEEGVLWSSMPHYDTTDIDGSAEDSAFIAAARSDVPRLMTDLRRAHARIADLEAQIAATAAAHREDQRRADELAGVPG